jgi:hypothetical protein
MKGCTLSALSTTSLDSGSHINARHQPRGSPRRLHAVVRRPSLRLVTYEVLQAIKPSARHSHNRRAEWEDRLRRRDSEVYFSLSHNAPRRNWPLKSGWSSRIR